MNRTLFCLALLCALAAAQERDTMALARQAVVGISARRNVTFNFRGQAMTRAIATRQVGVVIGKDRLILTAALGDDPSNLRVHLPGSTEGIDAEVVDSDETFTVLRAEEGEFTPLPFALDWKPAVGQKVYWIGLLAGATGKWTPVSKEARVDALIQEEGRKLPLVYSDPPFSGPVSSLCALVLNGAGQAIGVALPKAAPQQAGGRGGGGRRGGGFARGQAAIPVIHGARSFLQYLSGDIKKRGILGVRVETLGETVAEALGMKGTKGVLVTQITPGSGAAIAGLKPQDVITKVGDTDVTTPAGLRDALRGSPEGTIVDVDFVRVTGEGPVNETAKVQLGGREEVEKKDRFRARRFGFVAQPLTPSARTVHDIGADLRGVHVRRVTAGSPAALARPTPLRRGDIILKVGETEVGDVEALKKALAAAPDGKAVILFVRNRQETRFVEITPEKADE